MGCQFPSRPYTPAGSAKPLRQPVLSGAPDGRTSPGPSTRLTTPSGAVHSSTSFCSHSAHKSGCRLARRLLAEYLQHIAAAATPVHAAVRRVFSHGRSAARYLRGLSHLAARPQKRARAADQGDGQRFLTTLAATDKGTELITIVQNAPTAFSR